MNEIPIKHAGDLFGRGERAYLARQALFFQIIPYVVVGKADGAELTRAQYQWTAEALRHLRNRANALEEPTKAPRFLRNLIEEHRLEWRRLRDDYLGTEATNHVGSLKDEAGWRRLMQSVAADFILTPLSFVVDDTESEHRAPSIKLYNLARDLFCLKTFPDTAIAPDVLRLCRQGTQAHPGFDRTTLKLTKGFVLQVASVLSRTRPEDFPLFSRDEAPDLRRAERALNEYAAVAPLLCAMEAVLGPGSPVSPDAPRVFAKDFQKFVDRYDEVWEALMEFSAPREDYFQRDKIYLLKWPSRPVKAAKSPSALFLSRRSTKWAEAFIAAVAEMR